MKIYITSDPVTTLVGGIVFAQTTPTDSIEATQADIDAINSSGGVTGWTIVNGVLTAPTAQSLLLAAKKSQKNQMRIDCARAIYAGFAFTYGQTAYTVTLREDSLNHDQSNLLGLMISANFVLMGSKLWQPNAQYAPSSFCNDDNGVYYVTYTGGLSGASAPVWPTDFQVSQADNTVTWYKMGFRVSTVQGRIIVDPKNLIMLGQMYIAFKNQMQGIYDQLTQQIDAAATTSDVQAITWPAS